MSQKCQNRRGFEVRGVCPVCASGRVTGVLQRFQDTRYIFSDPHVHMWKLSPLKNEVFANNVGLVKYMINFDEKEKPEHLQTALDEAVCYAGRVGQKSMLDMLIDKGANVNSLCLVIKQQSLLSIICENCTSDDKCVEIITSTQNNNQL